MHKHKGHIISSNAKSSGTESTKQATIQAVMASVVKLADFVMYQSLDDLGVNFFMSNYVSGDPTVSQLHYLPALYAKTGYANPGLKQSITAAGLAGYAKTARRKDMTNTATKSYISAIRAINTALSDPNIAAQDSTLVSIVIAAMFEVLINPRAGMQNCSKHLEGAVAVALLSMKYRRQTDVTRKLLTTLVQNVVINSWIQHIPLPPGFTELKKQVGEKSNSNSVHGDFLDIVLELVQFRHALQDGIYDSPMAIIRKALEIDNTLTEFLENMPRHARFDSFRVSSVEVEQLAYGGYYHIYPQRFTARLWNNVRSSRLRLHQVVLQQCQHLTSLKFSDKYAFLSTQRSESEAKIHALTAEMIATVPQLAGYAEQLGSYRIPTEQNSRGRDESPSLALRPGKPQPVTNIRGLTVELSTPLAYNLRSSQRQADLKPTAISPSSSARAHEPQPAAPTQVLPAMYHPHSASLYHLLFQLYALHSIPHLPASMKQWIKGRIAWIEVNLDLQDLARLQDDLSKRPGDGFPVDEDQVYVMQTYEFSTRYLRRPAPLLLSYD
ncbi:uncharacterized protein K460DRAFT_402562 [Cucurbitaria berberidis CBS 394.84]|uniref:Uncharacterized protein n=1 Tax=Cucurbitaria berberidis CBS 394.84 TaxID=1168544 RepID=A0A9P4GKN6_9PLEO|nr:uncharacterized protein K460DRAFT_402562 [Cucurbitaria berberidis CBS 394.84]KAF1847199.1 hypothetical protein K460DRAFT_402562 [Cucurbitaria berberidis CBS 394.84]